MSNLSVNTITDASGGSTASINGLTPQASNMQPFNRIINGAMTINQRGLTGPTGGYFVDRWQVGGASATSLQTSGLPTGFSQALSINRTVAGTAYILQNVESKNVIDLNGQTATVSFWAKNVSGVGSITVNLSYANASDNFIGGATSIQTVTASASPSSSWTYYTASFSALPSSVVNGLQLNFNALIPASGTVEITGVQLEAGSTASPFAHENYGDTLQKCQRYYRHYQSETSEYMPFFQGAMGGPTYFRAAYPLSPPMRTIPALLTTGTAANYQVAGPSNLVCTGVPYLDGQSEPAALDILAFCASGTAGQGVFLRANGSVSIYIGLDAEL